jgi:hypothetical protein
MSSDGHQPRFGTAGAVGRVMGCSGSVNSSTAAPRRPPNALRGEERDCLDLSALVPQHYVPRMVTSSPDIPYVAAGEDCLALP